MTPQHGVDPGGGPHQEEMGLQPGVGQRTGGATHDIDHGQATVTLLHFQADTYKALAETLTFLSNTMLEQVGTMVHHYVAINSVN